MGEASRIEGGASAITKELRKKRFYLNTEQINAEFKKSMGIPGALERIDGRRTAGEM
jgi:hypothetical protein